MQHYDRLQGVSMQAYAPALGQAIRTQSSSACKSCLSSKEPGGGKSKCSQVLALSAAPEQASPSQDIGNARPSVALATCRTQGVSMQADAPDLYQPIRTRSRSAHKPRTHDVMINGKLPTRSGNCDFLSPRELPLEQGTRMRPCARSHRPL
jgi:hypothetical protein